MGDIKRLLRKAGKEPKRASVEIEGETFNFKGWPDTKFWVSINSQDEDRSALIQSWVHGAKQMFGIDLKIENEDVWKIQAVARYSDPPMQEIEVAILSMTDSLSFLAMFGTVAQMLTGAQTAEGAEAGVELIDAAIAGNSAALTDQDSSLNSGASRQPTNRSKGSRPRVGQMKR